MNGAEIALYFLGALLIGSLTGLIALNLFLRFSKKMLQNRAKKFSEGNLNNIYKYEGKRIQVDKFRVRQEDDTEKNIFYNKQVPSPTLEEKAEESENNQTNQKD